MITIAIAFYLISAFMDKEARDADMKARKIVHEQIKDSAYYKTVWEKAGY